jgi:thiol-disulfide isomerase/thioredoxin
MKIKNKFILLLTLSSIFGGYPFSSTFAQNEAKEKLSDKPPFEEVFKKLDAQVRTALKEDREKGIIELERVGRLLSKDYPKEFMPYAMLSAVAQMTPDTEKSLKILKELVALDDSDPKIARIVQKAQGQLKKKEALGKPLDMKFTALDGREMDLSQMKGKVVLIDFWATWCGPCVREIPSVKKTYDELHKQGFEIIGISMDSDKNKLESFLAKNEMPWPQFFDGKGWKTSLAQEHGISSIPAMWLVDKKGNLVDQNARSGLEEKVKKYLAQ